MAPQQHRQDELFAAIEGTAFTLAYPGAYAGIRRSHRTCDQCGGIPAQRYAQSSLRQCLRLRSWARRRYHQPGSAIFAFLAAGTFESVEEAQEALSPGYRTIEPVPDDVVSIESCTKFEICTSSWEMHPNQTYSRHVANSSAKLAIHIDNPVLEMP